MVSIAVEAQMNTSIARPNPGSIRPVPSGGLATSASALIASSSITGITMSDTRRWWAAA